MGKQNEGDKKPKGNQTNPPDTKPEKPKDRPLINKSWKGFEKSDKSKKK